jgi:Zn-dependent protease
MFVATYFLSSFMFGWAKPVSVNPRYFRRPKEGMALVAFAGPATNFVIALICIAALVHVDVGAETFKVIARTYELNLVLGLFNLIPIPPLDGSRIVGALLPDPMYVRWAQLDQYGMFAVFGLLFVFRNEFSTLLGSAFDHSTSFMVRIVGG